MSVITEQFPFPSQRMPAMASNMVSTSQPLAVQAGLQAMRDGGNAVDAAIVTAITLTVVEPTMNGIGGDAFCILWDGNRLHGLNASGKSPAAVKASDFAGLTEMPHLGWDTVTVPGAVSAWVALSEKFGKLPFERLFEAALHYAEEGFMVPPVSARLWSQAPEAYKDYKDFGVFLPGGKAPRAGDLFRLPEQAGTLAKIAQSKGESFYRGELAERFVAASREAGAKFTMEDLDSHSADWVELISKQYHGYELHEIPPNGQGLGALIMLGILEYTDISKFAMDSADALHCQLEAMKMAFADTHRYVSDPDYLELDIRELLEPAYLEARAGLIDMASAGNPGHGKPKDSGTVYLTTADASGMMVSYIQSNYDSFGSGIVIPGTGITLQNRGTDFSLQQGHPNQIGGGKRPFHTIIPAFLTQSGKPLMSFGVMGGDMQAQGHAQMVLRVCDYGMNPQAASDAPRWRVETGNLVHMEKGFDEGVIAELKSRGHEIVDFDDEQIFSMGGAQLIKKTDAGYIGGSDHRKDGMAAGF